MAIPLITEQEFDREVRVDLPVLVDFYAEAYPPCRQITPVLEQVAQELTGKLKVVRLDVTRSQRLVQMFRVQALPMMVLIAQGRAVDQLMGPVDKKAILDMVQAFLPAAADEITPKEMQVLVKQQQVVPVDVREPGVFARYRIPGAFNIPKDQVLTRTAELVPSDGRLRVLYGRTTDDAKELAEKIRERGVEVAFLVGGFLHWEAEGGEVERGA